MEQGRGLDAYGRHRCRTEGTRAKAVRMVGVAGGGCGSGIGSTSGSDSARAAILVLVLVRVAAVVVPVVVMPATLIWFLRQMSLMRAPPLLRPGLEPPKEYGS